MREATISELRDRTSLDERTGAVRSAQAAELDLPEEALRGLWTPTHLERLARTYWRFLARVTLGLVRVSYSKDERSVVLLARPLKLLVFSAPEYEIEPDHGVVRWRLQRGLLVAKRGRGGAGHLQIDVRRLATQQPERARVEIEVEVANFHPRIASGLGRGIYNATQSRIHVVVTHGFLRSLAKLRLAQSRVGSLATPELASPELAPELASPRSKMRGPARRLSAACATLRTARRRRRAAWRGRGGR
jgi:hypothetical protein